MRWRYRWLQVRGDCCTFVCLRSLTGTDGHTWSSLCRRARGIHWNCVICHSFFFRSMDLPIAYTWNMAKTEMPTPVKVQTTRTSSATRKGSTTISIVYLVIHISMHDARCQQTVLINCSLLAVAFVRVPRWIYSLCLSVSLYLQPFFLYPTVLERSVSNMTSIVLVNDGRACKASK